MKITIELTEAQVKGIKRYIKATEEVSRPTKQHIKQEIEGVLAAEFDSTQSAMGSYIQAAESNQNFSFTSGK